jgi:uncharacterized protein
MSEMSIPVLMAICGFGGGAVLGLTARFSRFCTLGAIEDATLMGDNGRLKMWSIAIAIAIFASYSLHYFGIIDLTRSVHLRPQISWLSLIFGGLLFGFGMSQVGSCPFGAIVRLGSGDMRAFVSLIVIGVFGYITMSGFLAPARFYLLDPVAINLIDAGDGALPAMLSLTDPFSSLIFAYAIASLLLIWGLFKSARLIPTRLLAGGLIVGLTVSFGWFATGYLGADDFDPQRLQSFGFIGATSDALMYLMTYSGASINFIIASTGGVFVGSLAASLIKRQYKFEAFDDAIEMRRHLAGSALMGVGGITALGCTVGQGITGLSTLSTGSLIATASIFIGAVFGLRYLLEDTMVETLRTFLPNRS